MRGAQGKACQWVKARLGWPHEGRRGADGSLTLVSDDGDGVAGNDEEQGAQFQFASSDGSVVVFSTAEALSGSDSGSSFDLYRREANGTLTFLTDAPGTVNSVDVEGGSPDASRIVFRTPDRFDPALDGDTSSVDLYARVAKRIVTALTEDDDVGTDSPATDPADNATFLGISADATRVVFETADGVGTSDGDGNTDVFVNDSSQTPALRLFSDAAITDDVAFEGLAADTDLLFFSTDVPLSSFDTDASFDIYRRETNGTNTLISDFDFAGTDPDTVQSPSLIGASADGSRAVFQSVDQFYMTDDDSTYDIFRKEANGDISRLSENVTGATHVDESTVPIARGLTPDAGTVLFNTGEQLASTDNDTAVDVYASSGDLSLVHVSDATSGSDPNTAADAQAISDDASRMFFDTDEPMLGSDTDASSTDIYMRGLDGLQHLSDNPTPNATDPSNPTLFDQINSSGTRMFFVAAESMASSDGDGARDVYVSRVFTPAAGGGGNTGGGGGGANDTVAPALSSVGASPATFRLGSSLPALLSAKKVKKGTTLGFTLSEAAKVTFAFEQRARGRKVGKRCRKPTRGNRRRKRCTRFVKRGSLTVSGHAGKNRVRFQGRLSRGKKLRPGRYRMLTRAADAARNRSKQRTTKLRTVR